MTTALEAIARNAFSARFSGDPSVFARAPGRVELLGNHTDYNGGLVLAAAIDRFTVVLGRPRKDRVANVVSADLGQADSFSIDAIERGEPGSWTRYIRGVVWALQERFGPLKQGFDLALAGDVPLGAGLSSSASLQAAVAMFLWKAGLDDAARMELAPLLQRSENEFVGVNSGLLDQFSVLMGRENHALMLDCSSLDYERVPMSNPAPAIVICDSKTSRKLADGMYNRRREECERVVAFYQKRRDGVRWLRDVDLEEIEVDWEDLDPVGRLRARHVLTENERVWQGVKNLKAGDVAAFGRLMTASHLSSRLDFENSSPALDALISAAENAPGFLGGKLSGAGWAGCTVNLVEVDRAEEFASHVKAEFLRKMGVEPAVHVCHAGDGGFVRDVKEHWGEEQPR